MEKELIKEELFVYQPKTSVTVISKGRVVSIQFTEITHVSKFRNETFIYTTNNIYRSFYGLEQVQSDLPVNDFFHVHRSHIVSLSCINEIEDKGIWVGNYFIPLTKYYKLELVKMLGRLLNSSFKSFCYQP